MKARSGVFAGTYSRRREPVQENERDYRDYERPSEMRRLVRILDLDAPDVVDDFVERTVARGAFELQASPHELSQVGGRAS